MTRAVGGRPCACSAVSIGVSIAWRGGEPGKGSERLGVLKYHGRRVPRGVGVMGIAGGEAWEYGMPGVSDIAICLRRWDFSETSQTVSLFAREHGLIRGLAKGAKREKGRFSGGFDVLTRGQVVAIVKPGAELATLTDWHLERTYRAIRQRLEANRIGLYMADLTHHMLTDHDPQPRLFDALSGALDGLAQVGGAEAALLGYQWAVLEETGYRPQVERDVETGAALPKDGRAVAFSARSGGIVVEAEGEDRWRIRRTTVELLQRLARGEPIEGADGAVVRRANRLLAAYGREIVGREMPAFRWAFSDLEV